LTLFYLKELLAFADPSIQPPLYNHQPSNNLPPPVASQHATGIVDDMFLSLDQAFTDDYEKLKRITSEVQQFCNTSALDGSYSDLMVNASTVLNNNNNNCMPNNNHNNSISSNGLLVRASDVSTTFLTTGSTTTVSAAKSAKKYKKTVSNNNNSTTMNNLNHTSNGISSTQLTTGQRKERSLLEGFQGQVLGECARQDPHRRKAVCLYAVRQIVSTKGPPRQALPNSHGPEEQQLEGVA
jgi:hypothetical protein